MNWFEVDRDGLRQLMEGKDKSFIIRELVQNCWDEEGVTYCNVTLKPFPGKEAARLTVEDDAPEGFYDLRHAYTFYAKTRKRANAEKRGRFNLGEKMVLSLCRSAVIITTKGTVEFREDGERRNTKGHTESGSVFIASLPMTQAEIEQCVKAVGTFIPPEGIRTTLNGEEIPAREKLAEVEATLQTEFEDAEGRYRPTKRRTKIAVYQPLEGEAAMIYEMGLPVTGAGDRWHYDIQQRVPLTADRDNVQPTFLQDVRAEVANAMAEQLSHQEVSEKWIRDAAADERIEKKTIEVIARLRWGEKRAVVSPSDSYGKERAIAGGYHLVSSAEMSKAEWEQMRKARAVPSTESLFQKPAEKAAQLPEKLWNADEKRVVKMAKRIAMLTLGVKIQVQIVESPNATMLADFNPDNMLLRFNMTKLGEEWFGLENIEDVIELIIHELGHHFGNHLTKEYYDGLARIGAKLALTHPQDFQ